MRKILLSLPLVAMLIGVLLAAPQSIEPPPIETGDHILDCLTVQIHVDGQWRDLQQELAYAHTGGAMLDGALVFVPLDVLLANGDIDAPVVPYTEDFDYRVIDDGYPRKVECQPRLLQFVDGAFVRLPDDTLSAGALPEGMYLLQLNFQASRWDESYAGSCFAWLRVGNAELPALPHADRIPHPDAFPHAFPHAFPRADPDAFPHARTDLHSRALTP